MYRMYENNMKRGSVIHCGISLTLRESGKKFKN